MLHEVGLSEKAEEACAALPLTVDRQAETRTHYQYTLCLVGHVARECHDAALQYASPSSSEDTGIGFHSIIQHGRPHAFFFSCYGGVVHDILLKDNHHHRHHPNIASPPWKKSARPGFTTRHCVTALHFTGQATSRRPFLFLLLLIFHFSSASYYYIAKRRGGEETDPRPSRREDSIKALHCAASVNLGTFEKTHPSGEVSVVLLQQLDGATRASLLALPSCTHARTHVEQPEDTAKRAQVLDTLMQPAPRRRRPRPPEVH